MATIERDGAPWLTIDCGSEGLTTTWPITAQPPHALFITHTHLDHVAGFERLFVASYFDESRRGKVRLYVPATVVPLLHQRVGDYPNALAEGGANFWDAFQVIPVVRRSGTTACGWKCSRRAITGRTPRSACACAAALVWTGDTRPIPEQLAKFADAGELVAHDCALHGNPSHSGIDDLEREYPRELLARCLLYHYASARTARRWPRAAIASRVRARWWRWPNPDAQRGGSSRERASMPSIARCTLRDAAWTARCTTCACR